MKWFKELFKVLLLMTISCFIVVLLCEHPMTFIAGYLIATIVSWVLIPIYFITQIGKGVDSDYYIIEEGLDEI